MDPYAGFAAIYERWSAPMTEDVAFSVDLAREADGPIVELAVGTGRVAIPVASTIGRRVIGIDMSSSMLEIARERAAAAGVELDGKWHTNTGVPHRTDYFPPDNRISITLKDESTVTLWWIAWSEWVRADRCRRPRNRGALRLVRPPPIRRYKPRVRLGRTEAGISATSRP